jgi:carnitine O-acetyltransferase
MAVSIHSVTHDIVLNPCSFHACRYPTKPSDTAKKFDPKAHNHVVFVRKNKFYEVLLTTPEGHELSEAELEVCVLRIDHSEFIKLNITSERRQVERVIKMAGKETGVPVGALTAENRDIWTDVSTWRFSLATTSMVSHTFIRPGTFCTNCKFAGEPKIS